MNYSPKRFTNPGLLRRIGFPQLIQLLEPHKAFFDTKPDFCWAHDPADFSFEVLAKIMMNLDHTTPAELFESLYFAEFFGNSDFSITCWILPMRMGFALLVNLGHR